MKEIQEYEKDIASIRTMMDRSVKFISLSGLSGVLAGIYALAGATAAYFILHSPTSPVRYKIYSGNATAIVWQLLLIAILVLIASISTGLIFSNRKAKKYGVKLWTSTTRQLILNLSIPLVTGGLFILILLYTGHFNIVAPTCLIFYGLALIHGSSNLFDEVRYLGYTEIILGLLSALFSGYDLQFWAIGFGVMHIVYGAVMHFRYDK
jgi:predicted lysophospholipase L1 biosynthesis ABC-type transport system permease subunit